jgi:hypothetical protein
VSCDHSERPCSGRINSLHQAAPVHGERGSVDASVELPQDVPTCEGDKLKHLRRVRRPGHRPRERQAQACLGEARRGSGLIREPTQWVLGRARIRPAYEVEQLHLTNTAELNPAQSRRDHGRGVFRLY